MTKRVKRKKGVIVGVIREHIKSLGNNTKGDLTTRNGHNEKFIPLGFKCVVVTNHPGK